MKTTLFTLLLAGVMTLSTNAFGQDLPDILPEETPAETLQLLRVYVPALNVADVTVVGYVRDNADQEWREELPSMVATIGRNGVAPQGEKREKDGHSPQAEYAIGFVFGVSPNAPEGLKLPYRQATKSDFWIDEGEDPRYNHWISGETPEASHEDLVLNDQRYDLCLTTMYNENPTQLAKGSAIFLHLWKEPGFKTSGCIALSREDVLKILRWFDPKKAPRIRIELGEEPKK